MKILHIRSGSGFFGAERVILELSSGMCKAGNDIEIINFKHDKAINYFIEKAKNEHIKVMEMYCSGKIDLELLGNLKQYIIENKIDIIHSHDYKTDIYAFVLSFFVNSKFIATCHNWASDSRVMGWYKLIDKIIMRRFNKVVTVSKQLRNELLRSCIAPDKVVYIPNGISLIATNFSREDKEQFKKRLGLHENCRIVVAIGRLSKEKGYDYLVTSFKKVASYASDLVLLIVGEGIQREYLVKIVLRNNLQDKVILLGQRNDIANILAISDIFVMSSLKEGLPIALLEAMSQKLPVIATMVGDIPEIIVNGENGVLVRPKDTSCLADAIITLLNSKSRCLSMGKKGYTTVLDKYTSDKMVERYSLVYEEALNN